MPCGTLSIQRLTSGYRVTAIYPGNRVVLALLSFVFLTMVGVNAWLVSSGIRESFSGNVTVVISNSNVFQAVQHSGGIHSKLSACIPPLFFMTYA